MFCWSCGKPLSRDIDRCGSCGAEAASRESSRGSGRVSPPRAQYVPCLRVCWGGDAVLPTVISRCVARGSDRAHVVVTDEGILIFDFPEIRARVVPASTTRDLGERPTELWGTI